MQISQNSGMHGLAFCQCAKKKKHNALTTVPTNPAFFSNGICVGYKLHCGLYPIYTTPCKHVMHLMFYQRVKQEPPVKIMQCNKDVNTA